MHHDDDVSLAVKVEISSISGGGFGGLPTFGNRSISTVIRLRDGETNMLAGLIRDDERKVASGIKELSDIPVIGRIFAFNRLETQQTDIILTLTPHIVRVLDPDGRRRARVQGGPRYRRRSSTCRRRRPIGRREPKALAMQPAAPVLRPA